MSLLGFGHTGFSLKDLLENPVLQNPPKISKAKDGGDVKQKEKGDVLSVFDPTSAFLGPNLWSTSDYSEGDVSLEYMDLDEFLSENGIPVDLNDNSNSSHKSDNILPMPTPSPKIAKSDSTVTESQSVTPDMSPRSVEEDKKVLKEEGVECRSPLNVNVEFEVTEQEVALATIPGEETFDPKARKFSVDELKPQPMIKKSRKVFVPDEQKDDKYWSRRKKNNVAAKRSRDARRVKENQIAMRACYLEKCNQTLSEEVQKLKKENAQLKKSLDECQKKLKS